MEKGKWKGKKILILGLGQYEKGSGIAAALFFARAKAQVIVSDFYYSPAMAANAKRLQKFKNVRCIFNTHCLDEVKKADLVIKHQRLRMDEPEVIETIKCGIPMESAESLFLKLCPCPVVGITGTRGKSTTTTLVASMLEATKKKVWLGGNLLLSPLLFLDNIQPTDLVVLELSSFQLEGTGAAGVSPHVACITNLMRDHLNTYAGMNEYGEAKAQIFRHQLPQDALVLNADDAFCRSKIAEASGRVVLFARKASAKVSAWIEGEALMLREGSRQYEIAKRSRLHIFGEHNELNILAATLTARAAGASIAGIRTAARRFRGLSDRQEVVTVRHGVTFINDTTATTPDGAIAALRALSSRYQTLRFILGGADKDLDFTALAKELKKVHVDIVVLPGTAHEKLTTALQKKRIPFMDVESLEEGFQLLVLRAAKGDAVVLSPACASFGLFQNEFDRGAKFRALVARID